MNKKDIVDAWAWIRKNNQSIPDDVLDLMKDAAIEKLASHTEVKGVDWEVLSIDGGRGGIIEKDNYNIHSRTFDNLYIDYKYPIISVRRLSDNEVFSVGDTIITTHGERTIKSFSVSGEEITIRHNCGIITNDKYIGIFNEISKPLQRTPLFVSKDGHDVYEGMRLYSVGKLTFERGLVDEHMTSLLQKGHHDFYYYFVDESASKEYVILNKPCLSVNDVLSICDTTFEFAKLHTLRLKELAKQKLDKQ